MAKRSNNTNQISLFPETVYEYHILLSPSDAVKEEVDALKQTLHEMVGIADRDRKSIAHITLLKTEGYESMDMKAMIKNAVAGEKKFMIKISGCDHFGKEKDPENILYLKIENPEPIVNLYEAIKNPHKKRIRKIVNRQTSIIDKPAKPKPKKLSIIPHITIARNISKSDFEKIDFTQLEYQAEWLCDRITIRRRVAGTDKHFSPAGEVKLG